VIPIESNVSFFTNILNKLDKQFPIIESNICWTVDANYQSGKIICFHNNGDNTLFYRCVTNDCNEASETNSSNKHN